jgi:hypothetical protein
MRIRLGCIDGQHEGRLFRFARANAIQEKFPQTRGPAVKRIGLVGFGNRPVVLLTGEPRQPSVDRFVAHSVFGQQRPHRLRVGGPLQREADLLACQEAIQQPEDFLPLLAGSGQRGGHGCAEALAIARRACVERDQQIDRLRRRRGETRRVADGKESHCEVEHGFVV